jgi:hypothetical protein
MFWDMAGDEAEWKRKTWGQWFKQAQEIADQRAFFHWELEFPEIFFEGGAIKDNPGWDAVIGNPPYVRVQELLHADIDYFKSVFETAHKRIDISILFFEIAYRLISNTGLAAYISSIQFLNAEYGRPLRRLLLHNNIRTLIDFKDLPVFEEATTYPGIIIFSISDPAPFDYYEIRELPSSIGNPISLEHYFMIDPIQLTDDSWQIVEADSKDILDKINDKRNFSHLSECAGTWGGVITGKDEIFNLDQFTIEKWRIESEILLPLVRGTDVDRWSASPSMWLLYPYEQVENNETKLISETKLKQEYSNAYAYLKAHENELRSRRDSRKVVGDSSDWYKITRFGSYGLFSSRKILTPGESIRNSFTIDSSGAAFSFARVYAVVAKSVDVYFLAAILNSKVLEFALHSVCPLKRGGYYTFSSTYLANSPIRRIPFTTPEPERARLVAELKQLYESDKFEEILAHVEACLPKDAKGNFISEQEKSDVVHDLLAFLAEKMLEMNRTKHAEIKGFLGWLEGYLGTKVDDLTPKTHLQSYYNSEFDAFLAILKKNRKKLAVDPTRREPGETLQAEFEGSVAKLSPLRKRIEQTDQLIDQIIYRLYGLTEEEIKIVESQ